MATRLSAAAALALFVSVALGGCFGNGGDEGDEDPRTLQWETRSGQARVEVVEAPAGFSSADLTFQLSHTGGVGLNRVPEGRLYIRDGVEGEFHHADLEAKSFPLDLLLETPLGNPPTGVTPLRDFFAFCSDTFVDALQVTIRLESSGETLHTATFPDPPVCPRPPRVTFGWSDDDDLFAAVEILVPPVVYTDRLGLRVSGNSGDIHYRLHERPTAQSPVIRGNALLEPADRMQVGNDTGTRDARMWHVFLCSRALLEQNVTVEVFDRLSGQVLMSSTQDQDGNEVRAPQRFVYGTLRSCP